MLHTAGLLEELGHTVEPVEAPVPDSFEDDFLLYWSSLALGISAGGKRLFNNTYDRSLNDNLTKGLARHAAEERLAAAARDHPAQRARTAPAGASSPTTTSCSPRRSRWSRPSSAG